MQGCFAKEPCDKRHGRLAAQFFMDANDIHSFNGGGGKEYDCRAVLQKSPATRDMAALRHSFLHPRTKTVTHGGHVSCCRALLQNSPAIVLLFCVDANDTQSLDRSPCLLLQGSVATDPCNDTPFLFSLFLAKKNASLQSLDTSACLLETGLFRGRLLQCFPANKSCHDFHAQT